MSYQKTEKTKKTTKHEITMTGKELREMIQGKFPEARLPEQFALVGERENRFDLSYMNALSVSDSDVLTIVWTETEEVGE